MAILPRPMTPGPRMMVAAFHFMVYRRPWTLAPTETSLRFMARRIERVPQLATTTALLPATKLKAPLRAMPSPHFLPSAVTRQISPLWANVEQNPSSLRVLS